MRRHHQDAWRQGGASHHGDVQVTKQTGNFLGKNYNPPEESEGGGLKEKGQNPDSGSKNSENQNNDAIS